VRIEFFPGVCDFLQNSLKNRLQLILWGRTLPVLPVVSGQQLHFLLIYFMKTAKIAKQGCAIDGSSDGSYWKKW
jgi:hypothetical protein